MSMIPLSNLITDNRVGNTPLARYYRDIDNYYHLQMIADNGQRVAEFQATSLCLQAKVASENLRAQEMTNDHLASLVEGMDSLRAGLDTLNQTATETLNAVHEQTDVLREGFELMAQRLLEQQKTLAQIAKTLRRRYETQMLELREQADKWLTRGANTQGPLREDHFKDAQQLLREVVKNPIGNQDYVTWFQIGWLLWKHEGKIADAQQAFYRAARLSEGTSYQTLSVRHLAQMQYLQGKYEEAYQTIQSMAADTSDHNTPFDAARYAAKTGRKEDALRLLGRSIELEPTTIVTMLADSDFKEMFDDVAALGSRRHHEGRAQAKAQIAQWQDAVKAVATAELQSQHLIPLPAELTSAMDTARHRADTGDYLTVIKIRERAVSARTKILALAKGVLDKAETHAKVAAEQAEVGLRNIVLPEQSGGEALCLGLVGAAGGFMLGIVLWSALWGGQAEQHAVSYADFEQAGISRDMIHAAIEDAVKGHFIRCARSPQAKKAGKPAVSGLYELQWDERSEYLKDPGQFRGFFAGEGNRSYIPNQFFDDLVPHETLAVVKVVGSVIRLSIGFANKWGHRRQNVALSYQHIQNYSRLRDRKTLSHAIQYALAANYIERVEEGFFDRDGGKLSKAAVYAVKWLNQGSPETIGQKSLPAGAPLAERSEIPTGIGQKSLSADRSENPTDIEIKQRNKTSKQQADAATLERLRGEGFDGKAAWAMASRYPAERIERQIAWIGGRSVKSNRLGMLRVAIEQDWAAPRQGRLGRPNANRREGTSYADAVQQVRERLNPSTP